MQNFMEIRRYIKKYQKTKNQFINYVLRLFTVNRVNKSSFSEFFYFYEFSEHFQENFRVGRFLRIFRSTLISKFMEFL